MKLYIVRHAKAISNEKSINASRYEKYCGGLSEKGKKQAEKITSELKKYDFDKIITSPLKRASKTIEPYINSLKVKPKIIKLDLINERDLGNLAGTVRGEVGKYQKEHNITNKVNWIPPNGESLVDVYKRAKKFLKWLKENCKKEDSILISSHGVFIRALLMAIDGQNINNFYNSKKPEYGNIIIKEI